MKRNLMYYWWILKTLIKGFLKPIYEIQQDPIMVLERYIKSERLNIVHAKRFSAYLVTDGRETQAQFLDARIKIKEQQLAVMVEAIDKFKALKGR